jgi:hypothetical protein
MWVPPGKPANTNLWRWDLAGKMFLPPGAPGRPKGIQVEMPQTYQGLEPRGFHMMASPAGTQAPVEHINYTPETGEVHGRGVVAPRDKLNYTLLPEEALGAGHGGSTGAVAQGMGAGAGVPTLSAFGDVAAPFAGSPPLAGSPTMVGPSPTLNRAAPQWGGGGTSFTSRMGMGQSDGQDLMGSTSATDSGGTTPAATTPAASTSSDTIDVSQFVPKAEDGTPMKPGDTRPIRDERGNIIGYARYRSQDITQTVPQWDPPHWLTSTLPTKPIPHYNDDGSVDIVDPSDTEHPIKTIRDPDPNLVAAAKAKTALDQAKLQTEVLQQQVAALQAKALAAKDETSAAQAAIELQTAQVKLQQAQAELDKSLAPPKPPMEATPSTRVTRGGLIWDKDENGKWTPALNPDGSQMIAPDKGNWQIYHGADGNDHAMNLDDPNTEDKLIGPTDPNWQIQNSGDDIVAVSKTDPSKFRRVWTKAPTQADTDAHNKAILDIEQAKEGLQTGKITLAEARIKVATALQDALYPQPTVSGHTIMIPPGATLQSETYDPFTGKTGSITTSGGPRDPRIVEQINKAAESLGGVDLSQINFNPQLQTYTPGTPGAPTQDRAAQARTATDQRDDTGHATTSGHAPPAGTTTPGQQLQEFAQSGIHEGSNRDMAPPSLPSPFAQSDINEGSSRGFGAPTTDNADWYFDQYGRRRSSFGGGQEMGAGMASGTTGWAPRPGAFPPAAGPGFVGGMGMGADGEQYYDANGNPIDPRDLGDFVNMQKKFSKAQEGMNQPVLRPSSPLAQNMEDAAYRRMESTSPGFEESPAREALGGAQKSYANWGGYDPNEWRDFGEQTNAGFGRQNAEEVNGQGNTIVEPPVDQSILQRPPHDFGEQPAPRPFINTGPGQPLGPNINVLPQGGPDVTDKDANWVPDLAGVVKQKVNEPLKKLLGWPKVEETPPTSDQGGPPPETPIGMQGGFDQPEIWPRNVDTGRQFPPTEPTDYGRPPNVKDITHVLGEGGTSAEELQNMQREEGLQRGVGRNPDEGAQGLIENLRNLWRTTGTGQEAGMMPPSAGGPSSPQIPPQGPGGGQPLPQWLAALLRTHPELLQQAGLSSPAGGAPTLPQPSAGWQPPGGASTPPSPPAGVGAPSPGGGPMIPPLDSQDVAGIGHRFGQDMNVGEPQHSGVDLQAPEGTPTQSPVDGFVQRVEDNEQGLGITVIIRGMDGSEHRLGHLKGTAAYPGMQVKMGQDLGSPVGDTGMTTGAHLHWGVRDGQGTPTDPTAALGPMASMPPVPGTEMMGPPGGVGGGAQMGGTQMGGGQDFMPTGRREGGMGSWQRRGRVGAGAVEDESALRNQLHQTWNIMQEGQMSPGGLGKRMSTPGSMFGVPRPPAPPPQGQGQGGQPDAIGNQIAQSLQAGGRGSGQFARAGAMPMRQQGPPSAPPGQNSPAQATTQSQQAGWTPQ